MTIEDIATEVGVSRQTVTRALNGMDRISEETRAKVLEASERLGYRPSRFAANLARSRKTRTIGFVVATFRNPYYTELTADLLQAVAGLGWHVTVVSHERTPELSTLATVAGEVDAVVGYFSGSEEEILRTARGVPVVLLGREATLSGLHSVDIDFSGGLEVLIGQLRARGSRRFGMLESRMRGGTYRPSDRRRAYEALVDARSREAVVVCEADYQSVDAGSIGFRELMDRFPDTDTVIAFSDLMAMGALTAAHESGVSVPDQVRIVGIDGLSLGAITYPGLSSLAISGAELARAAVDIVQRAFDGRGDDMRRVVSPVPLWRGSA